MLLSRKAEKMQRGTRPLGKKKPLAETAKGLLRLYLKKLSAITSAGTTAGTASTYRVGGTDRKTRTHTGIDKIDLYTTAGSQQAIIDQEFQTIMIRGCIVFLRLIQSQTQCGPGSAALHQGNTQGRIYFVLLHIGL
jgi:hypothetical protein